MFDPEIKEKWLAALRSGKYEQGTARLRTGANTYCCLGVLCDILDPDSWQLARNCEYYNHCAGDVAFPGPEILETVGAERGTEEHTFLWKLSDMNDRGESFEEIADAIERKL